MRFRYLSDARNFVHTLKLKNEQAWREYCKSGKKPKDIPSKPDFVYRGKGWIDWYDWIGIQKRTAKSSLVESDDHPIRQSSTRRLTRHLPFREIYP